MDGAGAAANPPPITQRSLLRPPSLPPGTELGGGYFLLHAGSSLNLSLLPSLSGACVLRVGGWRGRRRETKSRGTASRRLPRAAFPPPTLRLPPPPPPSQPAPHTQGMTSHTMVELTNLLPQSPDRAGVPAPPPPLAVPPPPPAPLPLPSLAITASTVAALLAESEDAGCTLPPPSPPPPARRRLAPRTPPIKKRAPNKKRKAAGEQTSAFRGVTLHQRSGRYEAHCWVPALRRQVFAGAWRTELAAARAFDVVRLAAQGGGRSSSSSLDLNFPASVYEGELDALEHCDVDALVIALRAQAAAGDGGPRVRGVVV